MEVETSTGATPAAQSTPSADGPAQSLTSPSAPFTRSAVRLGRQVTRAAIVLIIVQAGYRAWLASRGWFVGDDFAFIGRADTLPLWSSAYLKAYNGHFMPLPLLLVRALNALWPMNYAPVVVVNTSLQALTSIVVFWLLRELFGARPAILVPLGVYLFSTITLPGFVWWSVALNQLPQQLAIATAVLLHVRYLRTGAVWRGWLAAAAVAGGLLCYEKTLFVVPFIAGFTVLFFASGRPAARLISAWRAHWKVWVSYLVVSVGYASYYLIAVPSPAQSGQSTEGVADLITSMFGHAVVPGLFGGPWHWRVISTNAAGAQPGGVLMWLSVLAAAGVVAATILLRFRAALAWYLAAGYGVLAFALLASSRAAFYGPSIGDEYRYSTDLCLITALCLALATMPVVGTFARGDVQLLVTRPATRQWLTALRASIEAALPDADDSDQRAQTSNPSPLRWPLVLVALLLVSAFVSGRGYDDVWHDNGGRTYVTNAESDLSKYGGVWLIDTAPGESVAWTLIYPYDMSRYLLHASRPQPRYFGIGDSAADLFITDESGHLRRVTIGGTTNKPGPDGSCGYAVQNGPLTIPLQSKMMDWDWVVRIAYISSVNTTTSVTAGRVTTPASIHRGLNQVYVMGSGPLAKITLSGIPRGTLCTNEVQVGNATPLPGSHP